jgi:hypothetical protein
VRAQAFEQDLELLRTCRDLLHAAHHGRFVSFDVDLHQIDRDISVEYIIQAPDPGAHHVELIGTIVAADETSAQMAFGETEVGVGFRVREAKRVDGDDGLQPVDERIAARKFRQAGVRLESEHLAGWRESRANQEREIPEIGTRIDKRRCIVVDEAVQHLDIVVLIAATGNEQQRATVVIRVDEHRPLIEQVRQRDAIAKVCPRVSADEIDVARHLIEFRLDGLELPENLIHWTDLPSACHPRGQMS